MVSDSRKSPGQIFQELFTSHAFVFGGDSPQHRLERPRDELRIGDRAAGEFGTRAACDD